MSLRIIGAGLPRTGTTSLKAAIEQLTGERCYHMFEVMARAEEHVPMWLRVLDGDLAVTDELFAGFGSAIDWPASSFWRELAARHPDALVVLTKRADSETWWRSAERTVWEAVRRSTGREAWDRMLRGLMARFHENGHDPATAKATYGRHLEEVRAAIDPERLVELQPGDGWAPLCAALGIAEPDEPYPHSNTASEFRAMAGWEA